MKIIEGGVCAAKGFKAGAMRCGIRKSHTKKDLAMILSDCVCNASAVYTTNRVKASPILLTKEHLADGKAQAVIVNSGNANACAPFGMENARRQAKAGARALGVSEENVIVASTGVIGQTLNVSVIENVYVAGGIGSGINMKNAVTIGMLPDIDRELFEYLGNTSLSGAYAMARSDCAVDKVDELASNMTYLELSTNPRYMDEFVAACFLPHTNRELFPSSIQE